MLKMYQLQFPMSQRNAVIKTFLSPGTKQMPKYRTKVGQGLTVDITTSLLGEITGVEIKNPGFGYEAGSVIKVLGGTSGSLATLVVGLGPWVKAGQQVSQNPRVVVENISLSTGDKGGPVYNYANMRGAIISTQWNVIGASHLEVPGKTTTSGVVTTKIVRPKEGDVSTANSKAFEVEPDKDVSYAPCVINVERGVTGYKLGKRVPATYADPSGGVKNRPEKVTGSAASFIVLEGGAGYDINHTWGVTNILIWFHLKCLTIGRRNITFFWSNYFSCNYTTSCCLSWYFKMRSTDNIPLSANNSPPHISVIVYGTSFVTGR